MCIFDVVEDGVTYDRALEKQEGETLLKHSTHIIGCINSLIHLFV